MFRFFVLSLLLSFMFGCVQEIPLEELENESFVDGEPGVISTPKPDSSPDTNTSKTPKLLQVLPEKADYVAGTKSVEIRVITDIKAHCRFDLVSESFANMTSMNQTDGLEHRQLITGLVDGDEKKYQIKCAEKADSTEGYAYKYSEIKILKNVVATLPENPPAPEITSLKFLGGAYQLEWKINTSTVLGVPDGGFDTILNNVDTADRTAEIQYSREYKNLDHTQKQCFKIEARWTEYIASTGSGKGTISNEVCLDPQVNIDMTAPTITSYEPNNGEYLDTVAVVSMKTITDENATCRYSLSGALEYKDMADFKTTGTTRHEHVFEKPAVGDYRYYVRCADKNLNISAAVVPAFVVKKEVLAPSDQTKDQLRLSVQEIFKNNCLACHGNQAQYQSVVDLSVDIKALEKNSKYIKTQDPEGSYLYAKVTSGSMAKYLSDDSERLTIYNWIKAVDGNDEVVLNCSANEAPLDNVCVTVGKTIPSSGYRMITPYEFFRDVNSIFNVNLTNKDIITGLNIIPEPNSLHGFDNQFGLVSANTIYVSAVEEIADLLGDALMAQNDFESKIVNCMNEDVVVCGMKIAKDNYIPKLFRRDLSDTELAIYKNYFETATGSKKEIYINFFKALVQSPSFIFREEHGQNPIPFFHLDPYEVASRLSYFVKGQAPDSELLKLAKDGSILDKDVRIAQAQRLMDTSIYVSNSHLAKIFLESIGIKRSNLAHDEALSDDMYRETIWVTRDVFFNYEQKWTNIFTNNYTYVNKRLQDIYGYNVSTDNSDWEKVEYPDDKRQGILSHASYLSAFYDGKDLEKTNDIRRGINFYEKILCKNMPLPPPDVDVDLDPADNLNGCRTDNRKSSTLSPEKTCIQCHQHFDRIGMGFERFNNKGEYREVEKDKPSCSTIENFYLDGATMFNSMPEFAKGVSENDNVGRCLALKMKSYAYGTEVSSEYVKSIYLEMPTFQKTMKFKDLIKDIVASDEFIKRKASNEN